jgi:hypothetical protein
VFDLRGWHEECGGELVRLDFNLFDAPNVITVKDEMAEFVGGVEARSSTVVLVGAEDNDWVILERQGEGVDLRAAEG